MTTRRSCSVPKCLVTATKNPEKYFFTSPANLKRRNLWLKVMKRDRKSISPNTIFYVCEDHFDLEQDLENYIKFKYSKGRGKHLLKREVVPHIFECQIRESESIRPSNSSKKSKVRTAALKRTQRRLVNECTTSSSTCSVEENLSEAESSMEQITKVSSLFTLSKSVQCNLREKVKSRGVQCTLLEDKSYSSPNHNIFIKEEPHMEDFLFSTSPSTSKMSENSLSSSDNSLH